MPTFQAKEAFGSHELSGVWLHGFLLWPSTLTWRTSLTRTWLPSDGAADKRLLADKRLEHGVSLHRRGMKVVPVRLSLLSPITGREDYGRLLGTGTLSNSPL